MTYNFWPRIGPSFQWTKMTKCNTNSRSCVANSKFSEKFIPYKTFAEMTKSFKRWVVSSDEATFLIKSLSRLFELHFGLKFSQITKICDTYNWKFEEAEKAIYQKSFQCLLLLNDWNCSNLSNFNVSFILLGVFWLLIPNIFWKAHSFEKSL